MKEDWFRFHPKGSAVHSSSYEGIMLAASYSIECSQCRKQAYAASDVSESRLYNIFSDRKWEVDRAAGKHRCDQCAARDAAIQKAVRVLPALPQAIQAEVAATLPVPEPVRAPEPLVLTPAAYLKNLPHLERIREIKKLIIEADLVEPFVRHLSLEQAWEVASNEERLAFLQWMLDRNPLPAPPINQNATSQPIFVEETIEIELEEPADWWRESA
jgi:hypothetical protein